MKKLPFYLSMALGLACIINMNSCSADSDYDEPWLKKEHRTRAAIMDSRNEGGGKRFYASQTTVELHDTLNFKITIKWGDGYDDGNSITPNPHIDHDGIEVIYPQSGEAAHLGTCNLHWVRPSEGAYAIEGDINFYGHCYLSNESDSIIEYNVQHKRIYAPVKLQFSQSLSRRDSVSEQTAEPDTLMHN